MPPPVSAEQLRVFSLEHISYEVDMLVFTMLAIGSIRATTPDNARLRYALMEFFGIRSCARVVPLRRAAR